MASTQLESLINRLEQVTQRLENLKVGGAKSSSSDSGASAPPQVEAYDEYVKTNVQPFLDTCTKLGAPLDKARDLVSQGFAEVRAIVEKASKSKKPSDEELGKALMPLNKIFETLTNLRMDNRQNPFFNHLYSIDEGIKCLAWVGVPNITVSYVKDMVNAAQFYLNKVLTEYRKKENGEVHVQFVEQLKTLISSLADYVKEYHTTGLAFNAKGGDFSSASSSAPQAQPQQQQPTQQASKPQASKPQTEAPKQNADLFASINAKKDSAATGLNRVTDDMKSKNRQDKTSVVSASSVPKKAVSKADAKFEGTAKFELEKGVGEKWIVEYQKGQQDLKIPETNLKQNVYIYRSLNSVISISGKVKGIVIDSCKKCAVVLDSVVSSVELVNCESVQVQINGEAPTVSVDKTDGFQLFLSKTSLHTKLVTSKSSEMNINVPGKTEDDDMQEHAVPEQYVTSYDEATGKFTTVINSVFM